MPLPPLDPPPAKVKRKRGGQPGNRNAFRHGFYSRSYNRSENRLLDRGADGQFKDELAVARVNAARLAEFLKDYKHMPLKDFVSASHALNKYLESILAFTRSYHSIFDKPGSTSIAQAMEELSRLPLDED